MKILSVGLSVPHPLRVKCSIRYSEGNLGHRPGSVCLDTTSHQQSKHNLSLLMGSIRHSSGGVVALVLLEHLFVVLRVSTTYQPTQVCKDRARDRMHYCNDSGNMTE